MNSKFFTNRENNTLENRLKDILTYHKNITYLEFLIGYFRISGFSKIAALMDNITKGKILVGINIDKMTQEALQRGKKLNLFDYEKMSEEFIQEQLSSINSENYNKTVDESVVLLAQMISDKKIEIRISPNKEIHSKIYILRDEAIKRHDNTIEQIGSVITGSSIIKSYAELKDLKLLVLDDLLISLDMSNRDIVLDILQEQFSEYQIIFLTHDRAFFEMAKQIFEYKVKNQWKYLEMYVDKANNIEIPFLKTYGQKYSNIEIAKEHFANKDYPATTNYLRKEVEKLFDDYLQLNNLDKKINLAKLKENVHVIMDVSKELKKLLSVLKQFKNCEKMPEEIQVQKCNEFSNQVIKTIEEINNYLKNKMYFEEFEDVKLILKNILHPQSHSDFTKPLYKKELEDAIILMEELKRIVDDF